ncbi:MAG: ABC transporter substrate-binding protein [Desulfobacterales bacterium]|nr:ABC transporter substrate-binding protein [Desulfobacterales bacterium]
MKKNMKRLAAVIVMLMLVLGASLPVGAAETVKIGYLRITTSLATFVAQDKGLFAQEGLQVELIPFDSGTAITDALIAGRIDAIGSNAITGFWFAAQTAPDRFKIFLTYGTPSLANPTFVAIVKKDSPLKGLKDLKGKKVGTYPGASSLALAKAIIRTQMDPAGVTYTELPPPSLISALAAGQIDAFFAPEPMGMMARSQGVGRDLVKEPLGLLGIKDGFAGAAYGFSAQFLKENPERAKKVKAAFYKAADLITQDKDALRPLLVKYIGVTEQVAMNVPIQDWIKIEKLNKQSTQKYFDLLYKEGAYKEWIDTTELYY